MLTYPEIRDELAGVLSEIYAPGCDLNCWQWAEEHIFLTPLESRDNYGKYDSSLTPYVRRLMEFVTTPGEDECIIMKSAQLGFTLAYIIIIAYLAATRPTHVLFGMDAFSEAKRINETRLQPLLRNCTELVDAWTGDDDDVTAAMIRLRRMFIYFVGSGAKGSFTNKSVGLVILDELDRHERPVKGGANTIDLARDRLKEVEGGKLIAGGTPEDDGGETYSNYRTGTREELHIHCPHCDRLQPIRLEQFRFDFCKDAEGNWDFAAIEREAFLECVNEDCRGKMTEEDKPNLLRAGRLVATNTGQDEDKPFPGRVSIWVNDFHSFRPKNAWGLIIRDFVAAKGSSSKMRRFFNSRLGLPRRDKATQIKRGDIYRLAGNYDYGCVPVRPAIIETEIGGTSASIILGVDVQGVEKKFVKIAVIPTPYGDDIFVVDYGKTISFDDLLRELHKPVLVGSAGPKPADWPRYTAEAEAAGIPLIEHLRRVFPGEWHPASIGFIDEGYTTHKVREWCVSTAHPETGLPRFFPVKGVKRAQVRDIVDEKADRFFANGEPITVYHFSDDDMKRELYLDYIAASSRESKNRHRDSIAVGRIQLMRAPDPALVDELIQEKLEDAIVKGQRVQVWADPRHANDYGDALKNALVGWKVVRPLFVDTPDDRVARADDPRPDPTPDPADGAESATYDDRDD